jgi:glycerol-3-phosphate dehydrogenase (NAD(P)+)
VIYSRNKQVSETINKERYNPKYLSTYKLRDKVSATSELTKETFEKTHVILMCIPTPQLRSVLKSIQAFVTEEHLLILANKGNFLNSKPFKELKWKRWICLIK